MEKLSDFFADIKERLASPLFSSFLISWLVINWRIPIGLLFYKTADLKADGYTSYMDLITKEGQSYKVFWLPLGLALAYTFVYPLLRNVIQAFNAWTKTWGGQWHLKIRKAGKISVEKYVQLRDNYIERTLLLQEVLDKESEYLKENESLKTTHLKLEHSANENQRWINMWRRMNNVSFLNGQWSVTTIHAVTEEKKSYVFFIKDGTVSAITGINHHPEQVSYIKNFHCNPDSKEMQFVIAPLKKEGESIINTLSIINDDYLKGFADLTDHIEFKRIREELRD